MADATALKRRLILSGFAGVILTLLSIICLAGLGKIAAEPTLGLVAVVCGSITVAISAWRWVHRPRQ